MELSKYLESYKSNITIDWLNNTLGMECIIGIN